MRKTPRNKIGDKKGYFPKKRPAFKAKRGLPEGFRGGAQRVKGGYVQGNYEVPVVPPRISKRRDGKPTPISNERMKDKKGQRTGELRLRSKVYHRWQTKSKRRKAHTSTVFDRNLRVEEPQPEVFGTTPKGRTWVHEGIPEIVYPKG